MHLWESVKELIFLSERLNFSRVYRMEINFCMETSLVVKCVKCVVLVFKDDLVSCFCV